MFGSVFIVTIKKQAVMVNSYGNSNVSISALGHTEQNLQATCSWINRHFILL